MKFITATASIYLAFSTIAFAGGGLCESMGEVAKDLMTARQAGTDMSALMKVADGLKGMNEYARTVTIAAYEVPAYATEEMKLKSISDFSNKIQLACYQK